MPHCSSEDATIHYSVQGDGPPLFLAFCLGGNRGMWGTEIDALARHHQVITWDPRGHGDSSSPADPATYGVGQSAQDLAALMDHLSIDAAIIGGVSMGGGISACFAGRYPNRTRAALIIDSNTAAGLPVSDKVVATRQQTIALCKAGDMDAVASYFLETSPSYRLFTADSEPNRQRLYEMIKSMDPVGFANTLRSMLKAETTTEDLKKITVPALVMAGENDPAMAAVELTQATIAHSSSARIANAGHLSNIDQPVKFAEAIVAFTQNLET